MTGKFPSEAEIDQVLCERHGQKIQRLLKNSRVGIAGLGGLGSNTAVSLTRAGIGALKLVDFDCVDLSNLNRQQYGIQHIGRHKAEALAEVLLQINPYLKIETEVVRVCPENVVQLFSGVDVLCEAFDVPEEKAMLVNTVMEKLPSMRLVSATGMAGYGSANEIVTRKITDHFFLCGDGKTAPQVNAGLMAPRVMVCAGHEANMILRLLLGYEEV